MVVVTLTADFGGHYIGIMKGVIKSTAPSAEVIELSTEVAPFRVKEGAFVLCSSYRYFPRGTIHVAVVDPGVGSGRRAVAVRTKNYTFIGPDNGVLSLAALDDGILEIREITRFASSRTFDGRDVFAPAAAHIAGGGGLDGLGRELDTDDFVRLEFFAERAGRSVFCEVISVDRFGNLILSLRGEEGGLGGGELVAGGRSFGLKRAGSYSEGGEELMLIVGSAGFYEVAAREGSAAAITGATVGSRVELRLEGGG